MSLVAAINTQIFIFETMLQMVEGFNEIMLNTDSKVPAFSFLYLKRLVIYIPADLESKKEIIFKRQIRLHGCGRYKIPTFPTQAKVLSIFII